MSARRPSVAELETKRILERRGSVTPLTPPSAARRPSQAVMIEEGGDPVDENRIPDDFFYERAEHSSKPFVSRNSNLPPDMFTMVHSFGYDCHKRANLHMLDGKTIVFLSGNMVQFIDLDTYQQHYLRSVSGGGLGALAVHSSYKYFAVGEKGDQPNIVIYEYPSLKLYRMLRGGTETAYAYLCFNVDGNYLASVGSSPDYMLTIWNWQQEKIVLRCRAHTQDVFRVSFSADLEGFLTSAGSGHIKFWQMADTFTGLKLQGEIGKFGKTEISDIEGYMELADGKVLSGSEWGDLLLWEGCLIKVEISRKNKKKCHIGQIQQIVMDEGELITIGDDGFVRVWDFETIDTAEESEESPILEMDPMNELKVGANVSLRSMVKSADPDEATIWYAQDKNGGIWKLDLSFTHTSMVPAKLLSYHAGAVAGCSMSPVANLFATVGSDGLVTLFDHVKLETVCNKSFNAGGTAIVWAPVSIDELGETVYIAFADGVVRVCRLTRSQSERRDRIYRYELVLVSAFKPHKEKVTALALNPDLKILASGSDEGMVFFFSVASSECTSIGFVNVPGPVERLVFSPEQIKEKRILVLCKNGIICDLSVPKAGVYDVSHSYHLGEISIRQVPFLSHKSTLRHNEAVAKQKAKRADERQRQEEERIRKIEAGELEPDDEEGHALEDRRRRWAAEDLVDEDEDFVPHIPETPNTILAAFYDISDSSGDTFWLSVDDYDAGYLYQSKFPSETEASRSMKTNSLGKPTKSIPVTDSNDIPISFFKFIHNGTYLLLGMKDGSIRVQALEEPFVITSLDKYWSLNMHDNNYGVINEMELSYDNSCMVSVGGDGNIFTYKVMAPEEVVERIAEAAMSPRTLQQEVEGKCDDIDDPSYYSIEDEKQKSEYDKMVALAEKKKAEVRAMVTMLRSEFNKLLAENSKLPFHLRFNKEQLEMAAVIREDLQQTIEAQVQQVHRELAWDSERHTIALEKLQRRFKSELECDHIVVYAFDMKYWVTTLRALKLDDEFFLIKASMDSKEATRISESLHVESEEVDESQKKQKEKTMEVAHEELVTDTMLQGSMADRVKKAMQKVDAKKKRRLMRKQEWSTLYSKRPGEDYEDPQVVADIKWAKENIGNYKLKSADDYVVPDHLRMNAHKARKRLLTLKEKIHQAQEGYNQEVLKLREKKINIIKQVQRMLAELVEVQHQVPMDSREAIPNIPTMKAEEIPEKKFEYNEETLMAFKEHLQKADEAEEAPLQFGMSTVAAVAVAMSPSSRASRSAVASSFFGSRLAEKSQLMAPSHSAMSQPSQISTERYSSMLQQADVTDMEECARKVSEIRSTYRQKFLLGKISELMDSFDSEVKELRNHAIQLFVTLKNADLRQVTLFEELILLKDFEKHENDLIDKVKSKRDEQQDFGGKISECQVKIELKQKDIHRLQEAEKSLLDDFLSSLGDMAKFADFLTKVFKKKIKRKKKEKDGEESESEESSSDESELDESESEADSETMLYDLDTCPAGCEQAVFDEACQLREKRLDLEEALFEEKKSLEIMKKELEAVQKRAKVIVNALLAAENELEAFQLEKQRKLNELDVVVCLKLHQVQYIENDEIVWDLSPCLVFEDRSLDALKQRIRELHQEALALGKSQRQAQKRHVELIKQKKLLGKKIMELDEYANQEMTKKFGKIVDMEAIETIILNVNVEELKMQLRDQGIKFDQELQGWEKQIEKKRRKIVDLIRQSTAIMDQINLVSRKRQTLEKSLDSVQKGLGAEFMEERESDMLDRQRLMQLVQLQAQEIQALKEEVLILSRKDGHILPPVQPPPGRVI